jgi:hypothetical protein
MRSAMQMESVQPNFQRAMRSRELAPPRRAGGLYTAFLHKNFVSEQKIKKWQAQVRWDIEVAIVFAKIWKDWGFLEVWTGN